MDALLQLSALMEQRLSLLRRLAESLESSRLALADRDAEAIARGAAHQAELCRQWALLEDQLRSESAPASSVTQPFPDHSPEAQQCAYLQEEWLALGARIRHLARVHWSLLRHMQRSAAVLARVIESCSPTYSPEPALFPLDPRVRAGE